MATTTCPHCGAENRHTPVVTVCSACGRPPHEAPPEPQGPLHEPVPEEAKTRKPLALSSSSLGPGMPPRGACCAGMITWFACILAMLVLIVLEAPLDRSIQGVELWSICPVGAVLPTLIVVLVYTLNYGAGGSAYEASIDAPASYHLGQTFTWGIVLHAEKPLTVGDVTYALHHWEYGEASSAGEGESSIPPGSPSSSLSA